MLCSTKIINAALGVLAARRKKAKSAAEEYLAKAYKQIPKLKELDDRANGLALEAIQHIMHGSAGVEAIAELKAEHAALRKERDQLLMKNGIDSDSFKIKFFCLACKDTGYVADGICGCLKRFVVAEQIKDFKIELPLERFSFENFKLDFYSTDLIDGTKHPITQREQAGINYAACRDYVENFHAGSGNMLLQGGTGLGKTHLSLAIARGCLKRGCLVIFISAAQLLRFLEDDRFNRPEQRNCRLDLFLEVALLIIDDMGSELQNQFAISSLYGLISDRLMARKPTIVNTNLSPTDINSRYGDRMTSRLFGAYKVLKFYGKDVRLQTKEER
jgi:DNA replication protein DnaC